jgi:hypothetical protein
LAMECFRFILSHPQWSTSFSESGHRLWLISNIKGVLCTKAENRLGDYQPCGLLDSLSNIRENEAALVIDRSVRTLQIQSTFDCEEKI